MSDTSVFAPAVRGTFHRAFDPRFRDSVLAEKRPGLWQLVLFRWNEPGAPTMRLLTQDG